MLYAELGPCVKPVPVPPSWPLRLKPLAEAALGEAVRLPAEPLREGQLVGALAEPPRADGGDRRRLLCHQHLRPGAQAPRRPGPRSGPAASPPPHGGAP